VAVFGSAFLTLDTGGAPRVSGHALGVTLAWVAVTMAFGVLAASLTRTLLAARQDR
jgi:hypothetical protein